MSSFSRSHWLLDNLQSVFVVIFSLDGGQTTQGRKWYIIRRLSDGQTNNNRYEEILNTIYCFLHWAISGISRKMELIFAACEGGREWNMKIWPGKEYLCYYSGTLGTVQSNMKTRQRIFYKFSLQTLRRSPELMPQTSSRIILAMEKDSSGRQHTDVFSQRQ